MADKAYERTEDGVTTTVTVREALAEVNHAMMDGKDEVEEMSSGRGRHHIEYKDGRTVRLVEIDAPAEQPAPEPQWRTLKGVTAPFLVDVVTASNGYTRTTGDRTRPTGQTVKVVSVETRGSGCRSGKTEDGRDIDFGGAATRMWITQL